jgi:tripartite-type tricarboxylate transporter receptor subunit TctC
MKGVCAMAALAAFSTMSPAASWAQTEAYPARAVKVIVPGPAGGGLDVIARSVVQRLSDSSRGQFYIENLPGAGGSIGSGTAARAPADGYTVLVINQDYVIHPLIKTRLSYDPFTSFTPVTLVAAAPETLLVNPSVPAKGMKELVDVLKANPGQYNYATPGHGTSPHLANERLFKLTLGTDVVHVPFQGAPAAVASTVAGNTQIVHITLPLVAPHITAGTLRALAVASHRRAPQFPDIPTLAEAGIPGHEVGFWVGIVAPAGTPNSVVQWLQNEIKQVMTQQAAKTQLESLGFELIASTSDELRNHIKAESDRWARSFGMRKFRCNDLVSVDYRKHAREQQMRHSGPYSRHRLRFPQIEGLAERSRTRCVYRSWQRTGRM